MSNLPPFDTASKRRAEEHSTPLFPFLNKARVILAELLHKVALLITQSHQMTISAPSKMNEGNLNHSLDSCTSYQTLPSRVHQQDVHNV